MLVKYVIIAFFFFTFKQICLLIKKMEIRKKIHDKTIQLQIKLVIKYFNNIKKSCIHT